MSTTPTLSLFPHEVGDGAGTAGIPAGITFRTQPGHGRHAGLSAAVLNFARSLG